MEFKKVKLGEIGKIVGGGTPKTKEESYYGGEIAWITPKDLSLNKSKYIFYGERNITEEGLKNSSAKLLPKGTVLFSSRAPIGYVAIAGNDLATNQGFKSVIPAENVDSEFIYYLLINNVENIKNFGVGSTFREVSGSVMKNIEIMIPDFSIQRKIAKILNTLDSKIEINNKIISNLESQAQAIFKSWFVDFEPFQDRDFIESELGIIPEGWEVKELGELFKFVKGKKPKDLHEKYEDNFIPYIVKGVMDGSETPKFTNEINIVEIKKLDCFMLMDGANSGNIYYGYDGALGSTFALLESKNQVYRELIYWKLKTNESIIKNQNTGSAIPHANKDFINKMNVAIPINIEENEILKTLENFRIKINSLNNQNTKLAELRDALLPKLMAGEIDVSNIKIEGEEVKNE